MPPNNRNSITGITTTKRKKYPYLLKLCFCQHSFYFEKKNYGVDNKYHFSEDHMQDLPEYLTYEENWRLAKDIIRESESRGKPIEDITEIIFQLFKTNMRKAIILRIIQNILYVVLTLLIKFFLPEVEEESKRRPSVLFFLTAFAFLLAFFIGFFKHHADTHVAYSKFKTEQMLRSLLFNKISKANSNFLEYLDSSVVEK